MPIWAAYVLGGFGLVSLLSSIGGLAYALRVVDKAKTSEAQGWKAVATEQRVRLDAERQRDVAVLAAKGADVMTVRVTAERDALQVRADKLIAEEAARVTERIHDPDPARAVDAGNELLSQAGA